MSKTHWTVALILFPVSLWASSSDVIQLLTFSNHSRLVFRIDESVPYQWNSSREGFELYLKGIGLSDLGAPIGEEERWKGRFEQLNDPRLKSLHFMEASAGVKVSGIWRFPSGKLTLAHPSMEYFDYREKKPSQYVVDFWVKPGPTLIDAQIAERRAHLIGMLKKAQEEEDKKILRKAATPKKDDTEDNPSKFCDEALNNENDVILRFYPVHEKVNFSKWFPTTTPDTAFTYYKPKKKSKDAQYVRLTLDLYKQGQTALAIRTLDFMKKEFPASNFSTEMKFLKANALIKLGLNQEGEQILNRLINEANDSPVALFSAMYLAKKSMQEGYPMAALNRFFWLIEHYPNYRLNWVFHLGAAECLYALKETQAATKEYNWIIEYAPDSASKSEAIFRLGDLYMSRFQYAQGLEAYSRGITYFNEYAKGIPAFFINRGEALYQLGQYDRAKEVFEKFLESYPGHPEGWRATFRLGEISARNLGKANDVAASRKWYYETINQFPFSPGVILARVRLMPCGDHAGFDFITEEKFTSHEASGFDGGGEVYMRDYPDFLALAHVRALLTMSSYKNILEGTVREYNRAKKRVVKNILATLANSYFRKTILDFLNQGKKYEALTYYNNNLSYIPELIIEEDKKDFKTDYLLKLSQTASDLGLGALAERLYMTYEEMTLHLNGVNRTVASVKPLPDKEQGEDIQSEIQIADQKLTQAKALWIESLHSREGRGKEKDKNSEKNNGEDRDGDKILDKIQKLLSDSKEDSKLSYQKELILGLIDEKNNQTQSALIHVSRAQMLIDSPRVDAWLASLQAKAGSFDSALDIYKNLQKKLLLQKTLAKSNSQDGSLDRVLETLGVPSSPTPDDVLFAQASILKQLGRISEVIKLYSKAIENGLGGGEAIYEYARILTQTGGASEKLKAQQLLENLAKDPTQSSQLDFWKKLAKETLADHESEQSVIGNAKEGKK